MLDKVQNSGDEEFKNIKGQIASIDLAETIITEDIKRLKKTLIQLAFAEDEITIIREPSCEEIRTAMRKIRKDAIKDLGGDRTKNALCFVYYAGHGAVDNFTYSVCGDG